MGKAQKRLSNTPYGRKYRFLNKTDLRGGGLIRKFFNALSGRNPYRNR